MLNQVHPINKSFCLQVLCEDNFQKLCRLAPNVKTAHTGNSQIHIQVLESGPFTHTLVLRSKELNDKTLPTLKCRMYLDTQSIEVITIEGRPADDPLLHTTPKDVLNGKWALNYFLEKWLTFRLQLMSLEKGTPLKISA